MRAKPGVETGMLLSAKKILLEHKLAAHGRLLVAYSGGVDSAFLAHAAHQALGANMRALIADSPSLTRTELALALKFARTQGIPCEVIETRELEDPNYVRNDAARCFHCKDILFKVMERYRDEHGFDAIAYGVNADDLSDFRPGQQAAREHHVAAPLLDAGLTKAEIRELSKLAGLSVAEKPAAACLASRIEYGRPVTTQALSAVEQGEEALHALGFRQVRVRHHGAIVRLEIAREELDRALNPAMAAEFTRIFKALGFTYVTLDLEGFRSGSMNAVLPLDNITLPSTK